MGREKEIRERLRACRKEYERVKARVGKLGFICKGSLLKRRLPCGNPNCRCHKDPAKLHGPYYQLSWKEKGKTVSCFLSPEMARTFQGWMQNRRILTAILDEMHAISRRAGDSMRAMQKRKSEAHKDSRRRK